MLLTHTMHLTSLIYICRSAQVECIPTSAHAIIPAQYVNTRVNVSIRFFTEYFQYVIIILDLLSPTQKLGLVLVVLKFCERNRVENIFIIIIIFIIVIN